MDRRVVVLASGGMTHRFWPLRQLVEHEASDPVHIFTPEARAADEERLGWMAAGDHARIIRTMPAYLPHEPEAGFGHYLAMVASVGGEECRAPGRQFSDYENATGTGQVHVWFDRPPRGVDGTVSRKGHMNRLDLLEVIRNGENSAVEFKRDGVRPGKLASEMSALLNLEGGHILLGVDDDGTINGLVRDAKEAEEWVMQVARDLVQPALIPSWQVLRLGSDVSVGVIYLAQNAPDKPYKAKQGGGWITKVRVGTTTRDASREEEQRLYQQSGGLRYGLKPVLGAAVEDLDHRRLQDYFTRVLDYGDVPSPDSEGWETLLSNLDLAVVSGGRTAPTVDGCSSSARTRVASCPSPESGPSVTPVRRPTIRRGRTNRSRDPWFPCAPGTDRWLKSGWSRERGTL